MERHNARRVVIFTNEELERNGVVEPAKQFVKHQAADLLILNELENEPSTDGIKGLVGAVRDFQPDLYVGLGGGAVMDTAKACNAVITHRLAPSSLFGFDQVPGPTAPLVCLPTTSGSGSEVSHACHLRNSESGEKATVLSRHIRPDIAIVDPYLTVSCPRQVTAQSGSIALAKAIESYLVSNFFSHHEATSAGLPYEGNNPFGDMFAERSISLIVKHLRRVVEEPEDIAARTGMSLAATFAGIAASQCGIGLTQTLAQSLESKYGGSFGTWTGIVLPHVVRFESKDRSGRIAKLATLLGVDARGLTVEESVDAAIDECESLREDIGLPSRLRDAGIAQEDLESLSSNAVETSNAPESLESATQANVLEILNACY